ncbi:HAD family hydrolase [Kribbella sp. NPDC051587]|uniref:HAD family hydrolase n=1 Tax=Kribbella sp. NPDC051587 TaxID=3364119 RepID=UPI003795F44F
MDRPTQNAIDSLPPTLILWDVDHTLIENGGVSKDTYALGFELLVGRSPEVRPTTHGRTDFQIMRELFAANSIDSDQYAIADIRDALLKAMETMAPQLPERGYALPGARETLKALAHNSRIIQSTLTGNIQENGRSKLAAFGLDNLVDLEVGGYGSDNIVRSKLVDAAREKVFRKYAVQFDEQSTVLIGDTPLDVKAAIDGGAQIIAVASGVHGIQELRESGARVALDNLRNLADVVSALTEVRG